MYAVDFWCSDPSEDNDDCATGKEFDNLADAESFYNNPFADADFARFKSCTAVIVLDGPVNEITEDRRVRSEIHKERPNPDFVPYQDNDDWDREIAHQAGMMGGTDAYNDACGY